LAPAGLNVDAFQREHSAISRNPPARPTSLGDTEGPITIRWQDGPDAKVLIRNLGALAGEDDIRHAAETVLAHITRFKQDDRLSPKGIYKEIYIERSGKEETGGSSDFAGELVKSINELNHTDYKYDAEDIEGKYIKIRLGPRQAIKSARNLIESDDPDADEISTALIRRKNQQEDLDRSDDEVATRSAGRSGTGEDERSRDQAGGADADIAMLPNLARKILSGAQDVHDETLDLSEGNRQLLGSMKSMYDNLLVTKRRLLDLESQIEATFPPSLPLETMIGFQPEFQPLSAQEPIEAQQLASSYEAGKGSNVGAAAKLEGIFNEGLKPANSLIGKSVAVSGDEKVAKVVSVNVFPFSTDAKTKAGFAAKNRAGGAIPIALEQQGDRGAINLDILQQRAVDSAVLIIDPTKLDPEQTQQVQQSQEGGGGELGLSDVKPQAIVAALVPGTMSRFLNSEFVARRQIHFVRAVESSVYYAGAGRDVELSHPDYQSALEKIFTDNPKKTLLVHTTRLGKPMPITKQSSSDEDVL